MELNQYVKGIFCHSTAAAASATTGDIGPILSNPEFVRLREEIRSLIHQPDANQPRAA